MTTPSDLQDDLGGGFAQRRDDAGRPKTPEDRRAVAAYAAGELRRARESIARTLDAPKFRTSRRAWSGGTGKHGGPQTGTVQVSMERPDLPPPRAVGRGEGRPSVMLIHTAAAPASLLLPGEWLHRFTSDDAAREWARREGWTIREVPPCSP